MNNIGLTGNRSGFGHPKRGSKAIDISEKPPPAVTGDFLCLSLQGCLGSLALNVSCQLQLALVDQLALAVVKAASCVVVRAPSWSVVRFETWSEVRLAIWFVVRARVSAVDKWLN